MNVTTSKVVNLGKCEGWALDVGNMTARYSCHHYGGRGYGACGGCYARAMRALETIEKLPPDDGAAMRGVAADVFAQCQSEKDEPNGAAERPADRVGGYVPPEAI